MPFLLPKQSNLNKSIGISGCGWLGLPLAQALLGNNIEIRGTTTTASKLEMLRNAGISPFQITLGAENTQGDLTGFLKGLDILIINIPPKLRRNSAESYVEKMRSLYAEVCIAGIKNVIFVSSTSVYGDQKGELTEDSLPRPVTTSGKQLLEVEELFRTSSDFETTILRFGGLIGPGRHPVTRLSGKKGLTNGNDPVNLIHLNDAIHMIVTILEMGYWNELFNGVYPLHPLKRDYYKKEAQKRGIAAPEYVGKKGEIQGKIIISRNFLNKKQSFLTSITL